MQQLKVMVMSVKERTISAWYSILRLLMSVVHVLRIYPLWAKLYRATRQRKWRGIALPKGLEPREAQNRMNTVKWRKDTWREAWDAVGSPQWVQHCMNVIESGEPQPEGALDCDDFTSWATNVIDPLYKPLFFGQGWAPIDDENAGMKTTGHAVCVVTMPETGKLWHCGNWGLLGPFDTLHDVGEFICGNVPDKGIKRGEPLAWCLYTPNLRLIDKGNGLPPKCTPDAT